MYTDLADRLDLRISTPGEITKIEIEIGKERYHSKITDLPEGTLSKKFVKTWEITSVTM